MVNDELEVYERRGSGIIEVLSHHGLGKTAEKL
jgi:hypothetical protein